VISVAALGPDWAWDFFYNANVPGTTTLGPGWSHSFEIALFFGVPDPNSITVRWGDGRRDVFVSDGGGWAAAPALHAMRITLIAGGYRLRTKHGEVYDFDSLGRLIAMRDRNGNAMTFTYDGNGRLDTVIDATGRSCQITYDGQGRIVAIAGLGLNPIVSCEYQGPLLVVVRDMAGNGCTYSYDSVPLLVSAVDPGGEGVTVAYHPSLPVTLEVTTTDGDRRAFTYDEATIETEVRTEVALGEESSIRYRFDSMARCEQVVSVPLGITHNTYDAANNLIRHEDADGHVTTATFSPEGDALSLTDPTGATVSATYDPTYHLVLTVIDAAGNTWTRQRDPNGNLTVAIDPLGNQELLAYTPQGLLDTYTDQRGNQTRYTYDVHGYQASVAFADGTQRSATFTLRGRPSAMLDEEGQSWIVVWNNRDEPVSATLPGGEAYSLAWGADRMLISATGPRGETVSFSHNARKQLAGRTDPEGFAIALIHDRAGYLIRRVDALGSMLTIDRDHAGREVAFHDPDGSVLSLARNCCDIVSRTDERGTVNYLYSARHECVGAIAADGTFAISHAFEPRGLLVSAHRQDFPHADIGLEIAHDAAGRRVSVTRTDLAHRVMTIALDAAGNPTNILAPNSPPLSFTSDVRNRVETITVHQAPPISVALAYTPRGRIARQTYLNGVVGDHFYNANNRKIGTHYQGPGWVVDYNIGYDPSGNPAHVGAIPPPGMPVNLVMQWSLRNQPQMFDVIPGNGPTTIAYDAVGSRIHLNGPNGVVPYGYTPGAHRMVAAGPLNKQWDLPGGCVQVMAPGVTTSFTYRTDGSLRTITRNGQTHEFWLDALGQLAEIRLPSGQRRLIAADATGRGIARREYFAVAGGQPIDAYVGAPTSGPQVFTSEQVERDFWGDPIPTRGWWGYLQLDRYIDTSSEGTVNYAAYKTPQSPLNQRALLADPRGSITVVADGNGNQVTRRVYGLFGETITQTNPIHIATGFLNMESVEGLAGMNLAGYGVYPSLSHPLAHGAAALNPYEIETGSFLYDASFGHDGLYVQDPDKTWASPDPNRYKVRDDAWSRYVGGFWDAYVLAYRQYWFFNDPNEAAEQRRKVLDAYRQYTNALVERAEARGMSAPEW
jgi:YD repeat-containing protein